nr:PREDICTED: uncharacterized protein LOC107080050 isoform X2 [Lepisosteus oculatus]
MRTQKTRGSSGNHGTQNLRVLYNQTHMKTASRRRGRTEQHQERECLILKVEDPKDSKERHYKETQEKPVPPQVKHASHTQVVKEQLDRIKAQMKKTSRANLLKRPKRKSYHPFVWNSLHPYSDTHEIDFLLALSTAVHRNPKSQQSASKIIDLQASWTRYSSWTKKQHRMLLKSPQDCHLRKQGGNYTESTWTRCPYSSMSFNAL